MKSHKQQKRERVADLAVVEWLVDDFWERFDEGARELGLLRDLIRDEPVVLRVSRIMDDVVYARGNKAVLGLLVESGMGVNWPDGCGNYLHHFAEAGAEPHEDAIEIVKLLLQAGIDTECWGQNNWTALHASCVWGADWLVPLLMKHGADPTARTLIDEDDSVLDCARNSGV